MVGKKHCKKNCKIFYHGFGETTFLRKFVRNSLLCHISWKLKLVYFDFNSQVRATPHNILWIIYQRGTYILLIGFLFKTKLSVKRSKEGTSKDILSLTQKFCVLKHKQFDFFYLNVVELEIYFFICFQRQTWKLWLVWWKKKATGANVDQLSLCTLFGSQWFHHLLDFHTC